MKAQFLIICLFFSSIVCGQDWDKASVVNQLADIMNANYVYPEKGNAMHDLLKKRLKAGEYDGLKSKKTLAQALEKDLRSVINDKHIRVAYDPKRVEALQNRDPNGGREPLEKSGFKKVEILDGNIGYLDLRGFVDIRFAENDAIPAMDKLIEADAIIFDLRKNGGGSPSMIRFISSYLFEKRTHLNTFYWRPANNYSETWTEPNMVSQSKEEIPIYVLTSDYTFSAAEEFTYNLKNLKRATIIGEVTGGGAHPGGPMIINQGFYVNVPQGRAINPVTKSNWEGSGVKPHIVLDENLALDKAIELARKATSIMVNR